MPIPRDSHYVPGSNRHSVRLSDGQTVTRASAERIYAQSKGFRSNYERKEAFKEIRKPGYESAREQARHTGISKQDFKNAQARLALEYKRADNRFDRIDKSPNGALAQYLVAIGRRSDTADYAVGDSPTTK
jgi:hypothetical protein